MASQSDKSGDSNAEQDPLLEALESIKHLLDQTDVSGGATEAKKTASAGGQGAKAGAAAQKRPAASKAAPRRTPPSPSASGELDLPVLEEVVLPGQVGDTSDPAALARALRQLQTELSRSIDQTLQQAATQISARLKQELQQRIDAIVKNLK
ncbi:MAG: hypothetical protein P8009_02940 [Gammaproteobacteria bacterium]